MAESQRTPLDRTEYHRGWRERNREKCREYSRRFRLAHAERRRECARERYAKDARGKEQSRRWIERNPEKARQVKRRYRQDPENRAKERATEALWRAANPERLLWYQARARARKHGIAFTITHEDITIPLLCPVLGVPLTKGDKKPTPSSPTLDRMDNSRGYEIGNVMVISYRANTMKNAASFEELGRFCAFYAKLLRRLS